MNKNTIYAINGPVVKIKNTTDFAMLERVFVGPNRLIGEVISISKEETVIQVYESTTGLKLNDEVIGSKEPVSVTLGPGILKHIFDGIQRPLTKLAEHQGGFISSGSEFPSLDETQEWPIQLRVQEGDKVVPVTIFATTQVTKMIEHRFLIPPGIQGTVVHLQDKSHAKVTDTLFSVQTISGEIVPIYLHQKWPIKTARPLQDRLPMSLPLVTGQRVIDTLFPIAKGGTAALPGGFGTGKTMMQHQLAKWCDADIIVYVGCGERGNEMTQVLEEFQALVDPRSQQSLMERTVLIANTSNMPVAAREASIYTGLTIAEYYRDMGYHVAIMADSTSRWAEALREISGRLEEMPAEEGFPAYLPSRISQFYERAGYVKTLSNQEGSISIIGAVSPQGADFSEPVTQNTKRFVRCFWALDKQLAYARHYAAINWNLSYSEYMPDLKSWYDDQLGNEFLDNRKELLSLLNEENRLLEIVNLIGSDVLPDDQKLIIEIGKVIRLGFLQQNAFHDEDTYVPLPKQVKMLDLILYLYRQVKNYISEGKALSMLLKTSLFEDIIKLKYEIKNSELDRFNDYKLRIDSLIQQAK